MIIRMVLAVVLSTAIGIGVWQGTRAVWTATSSNHTHMTTNTNTAELQPAEQPTAADENLSLSVPVNQQTTVASVGLTPIQNYKARRYGLIVGLISLPFLLLIMLPLGREPEAEDQAPA